MFALQQFGQKLEVILGNTPILRRRGPFRVNSAPWTARTSRKNDTRETETMTIAGDNLELKTALGSSPAVRGEPKRLTGASDLGRTSGTERHQTWAAFPRAHTGVLGVRGTSGEPTSRPAGGRLPNADKPLTMGKQVWRTERKMLLLPRNLLGTLPISEARSRSRGGGGMGAMEQE